MAYTPEQSLQDSLIAETQSILDQSKISYLLLVSFGLDIAFFIGKENPLLKLIEVKTFVGSRQGGVGIGNSKGKGSQIEWTRAGELYTQ